jgi:hypothetical protein
MVSDDTDAGGLFGPILSSHRTLVESGLQLQRRVTDDLLGGVERVESFTRRTRLSSHYAAVRAVDRIEEAHPNEEATLDPLYDGVGRTFETLAEVDDGATTAVTDAVETTAETAEAVGEGYLDLSASACEPVLERLGDPGAAPGHEFEAAADD